MASDLFLKKWTYMDNFKIVSPTNPLVKGKTGRMLSHLLALMRWLATRFAKPWYPGLGLGLAGDCPGLVQREGGGLAVVLKRPNPRVAKGPGRSGVTGVPEWGGDRD
jgi:hypothetical protein